MKIAPYLRHRSTKWPRSSAPSTVSVPPQNSGHALRVKLHPENGQAAVLHPFGEAPLRPGRGPQALPQPVHRLVVGAVDEKEGTIQPPQQGVLLRPDRVDLIPVFPTHGKSAGRGQVLNQAPPQSHVEQLHPPADAEDGPARLQEGPGQGQLGLIPPRVRGLGAPVGLAKAPRVNVPSPAQHKAGAAQVRDGRVTGHRLRSRTSRARQ